MLNLCCNIFKILAIIFVVPSSVPSVPLLLLHGWPGSVREFYEAVPPLTSSRAGYDFSFEVVAPSLPGFGYSEAAARPGLGPVDIAVVMRNLMRRLGHRQYVVQGGDWGSVVTSAMATLFPDEILGYHTNMPTNSDSTYYMKLILGSLLPWYLEPVFADRVYPLTQNFADRLEETGYFHLQATKPDTIGVAISDTPAGLAAYLLEKFSSATNMANRNKQDGGLSQYRMEDLVDILMMYWHPNCATTSFRLYAESFTKRSAAYRINEIPTDVPTWALHTANEPLFSPASLLTHKYRNLINISLIDVGGHFAAFEVEKEFTEDVFRAVKEFRLWHDRNENRKG